MSEWLDSAITWFNGQFEPGTFFSWDFNVRALLAILIVSVLCGAVGSLVVGNRMAFFSDALAHCAFAGVSLGFLLALASGVKNPSDFYGWITPVMVAFGILVGLAIAFVRERTRLSNDTVIAVFFAGAVGFGGIMLQFTARKYKFNTENFLFGDPLLVTSKDLIGLIVLALATFGVLAFLYNDLVLTSFNRSLALARRVRVRLCNTLFIVMLAAVVNLCISLVGVLLINAVLIVPAATAANLCRNMRQLFWCSLLICVFVGISGQTFSWSISVATQAQADAGRPSMEVISDEAEDGVRLREVTRGGPAARAGLADGDIVVAINGEQVRSKDDFNSRIREKFSIGEKISVARRRDGRIETVEVILGRSQSPSGGSSNISFGVSGMMVVLSVLLFFTSMVVGPWLRRDGASH